MDTYLSHQFQWTYFQRVLIDSEDSFDSLNSTIKARFLPALFNGHVTDDEAAIFSMPIKKGGLAIQNPAKYGKMNYDISKQGCSKLKESIND